MALSSRHEVHGQTWSEFVQNNASVLLILLIMLMIVAALRAVDMVWRKRQQELEKTTGVNNESYAFALNLVRHFMPSFAVEKYQFRGMQAKSKTIDISFEDLSLELHNGARVLKGVTGEFRAGRMCAIMGPSGAGKTTFMNVLSGKATYGKMGGTIKINGKTADISELKSVIGFVPQDDIVHEVLTVREQIEFSAKLRNKAGTGQKRIQSIADDVLNVMQMTHIQNSIVGGVEERGISGGQRKRVNIGLELASQPTLLFLDEPTSGLDSTSSLSVAWSLKKMCELGMTSIMVIHQPRYSLFTLFDDVLLLGKGGQTVYLGPSLDVKNYFESLGFEMPREENPADWFMDVISGEVPNFLIPEFKPQMLFELWQQRNHDIHNQRLLQSQSLTRSFTMREEKAILERKLEEEWDMIDKNRDGYLQQIELRALLRVCSGSMPEDQVVQELFKRMAGEDAKKVSKNEFVDYLSSLRGSVAHDRLTSNISLNEVSEVSSDAFSRDSEGMELDLESPWSPASDRFYSRLKRTIPGFTHQLKILMQRRLIQWWRKNSQRALFVATLSAGSIILAVMDRFLLNTPKWDAGAFLYIHSALALLIAIFCLQVFGNDQPVFWRESSSGLNVLAFFLARTWINTFDLLIQTFLFTALYFLIRQPGVPFWIYMVPFFLVTFVASGWGYLISTLAPPKHGPFISSLVVFIVCCVLGDPSRMNDFLDGGIFEVVVSLLSLTRWSVAMSVNYQIDETQPRPSTLEQQATLQFQKDYLHKGTLSGVGYWWTATIFLVMMGIVLRLFASLCLRFRNQDKRA